ncbi:hypothetical protein EVAR_100386_1 [Eumeta japonica]|uniref:Uncharacterized protein n=1 Tax=Eumeta variegata TaxID=151549 RepID=A0A4C1ZV21_EUMVA|nr:hypothetical protein EVAR_100386_1 [Eumeta japonica]
MVITAHGRSYPTGVVSALPASRGNRISSGGDRADGVGKEEGGSNHSVRRSHIRGSGRDWLYLDYKTPFWIPS